MDERATLHVDVVFDADGWRVRRQHEGATSTAAAAVSPTVMVLIEPLYGGPALIAALDAGWDSVAIGENDPDAAPIPLISYDQRPPTGATTCRVRAGDLHDCVRLVGAKDLAGDAPIYVAARTNLRPIASRLVRELAEMPDPQLTIVCVPSNGEVAADAMFCAGALCRVLLEEWDAPARLTDAAGITTIIVATDHDPMFGLATGARFARHIERGGEAHDATTAAQRDMHAAIPQITIEGDSFIARRLAPRAAAT